MKGIYKHYKGKLYLVLYECKHAETEEKMVFYQTLYGDYTFWVRPKFMFEELLEDGTTRFAFICNKLNSDLIEKYQIDQTKIEQRHIETR